MSVIKTCESCGEEIDGAGHFGWDGRWYCSFEHMPLQAPPPCGSMVVHMLRLLADRASGNNRGAITVSDIEWTIQELER